jgi:hypothetical protein
VVFYELQRKVWDANNNGLWQVNAVGADNIFCKLASAGGSTAMFANVRCYTPAGAPADSKFSVLFALPSSHIAYAHGDQPSAPPGKYTPYPYDSWNPVGSWVTVNHYGTGLYTIFWNGVSSEIVRPGNVQVTAEGPDNCSASRDPGSSSRKPMGGTHTRTATPRPPSARTAASGCCSGRSDRRCGGARKE